jgi:hypothetical protein
MLFVAAIGAFMHSANSHEFPQIHGVVIAARGRHIEIQSLGSTHQNTRTGIGDLCGNAPYRYRENRETFEFRYLRGRYVPYRTDRFSACGENDSENPFFPVCAFRI